MKEEREHLTHYLILALILAVGTFSFWYFRYLKLIQVWTIVLTAGAYVLWGIIHHSLDKDLHFKLVLEYLSTAIFGVMVILALLLRA